MTFKRARILAATAVAMLAAASAFAQISLQPLGTYETGIFDDGAAEIVAHDPATQRLFVVNVADRAIDVLDINDPATPVFLFAIDVSPYGENANSVAVQGGAVAVAVEASVKQDPGQTVFFDTDGNFLSAVTVGALPDMVTFTPDGSKVLVANEGEPNDAYTVDPEGSISIIDVSGGAASVTQADVTTAGFGDFNGANLDSMVRIFGPGATVAQDLEPEFIAVSADSATAWVVLQENNAIAVLDVEEGEVEELAGLGTKNHWGRSKGLDASNKDGAINIQRWPVRGMYQPDAIAAFVSGDDTYLITANEGDARDYAGFSEETRVKDLALDPQKFPNAAELQLPENLGRLKTTTVNGDRDGDGDVDRIYSYGARSFSVWTSDVEQVFDSCDELEQVTAAAYPADFNSTDNENNSFDDRSDDKGPEPEGVVVGVVDGTTYAFVGLERIGGVVVYDLTNPELPQFVQYVNNRDFGGDPAAGTAGDLAPEGLAFIAAAASPNGEPLLVVANEVSGTTTIYQILH